MANTLTDERVQRWRNLWEKANADAGWVSAGKETDKKRQAIRLEILELMRRFRQGEIGVEKLKEDFDHKTRKDWVGFGFKGPNGAMFLNKLVKNLTDKQQLSEKLKEAIHLPQDTADGQRRMQAFLDFISVKIQTGVASKNELDPGRVPFFLSCWWHLQDIDKWPIFYSSGKKAFKLEGLLPSKGGFVEDYFTFRDCFLSLAKALSLGSWQLEHLCYWYEKQPPNEPPPEKSAPAAEHNPLSKALEKFTKTDALRDLFMTADDLEKVLARLKRKKAIILQGPPGVGKTFVARRLAFAIMGERDERRVKMVQFHPSYGYEDFVQGYRPTQEGLERRDGVFHEFARLARNDSGRDWFFIIDEINRGNLAKIFGELLMLLEADKRGPDHAILLTYSEKDETFDFPANLHVIGTMNTADRSLAMVDYALRRRFAFVTLHPAFDSPAFAVWLTERGASKELLTRIRTRVSALNAEIEKERDLGAGFRIGHSFFCPPNDHAPDESWYREVIESEIQPLLEEYFDSRERVKNLVSELFA